MRIQRSERLDLCHREIESSTINLGSYCEIIIYEAVVAVFNVDFWDEVWEDDNYRQNIEAQNSIRILGLLKY